MAKAAGAETFRDNAAARRYELIAAEGVSFADYRETGTVRAILHVEAPAALRGQGHAGRLMAAVIEDARARGFSLRPLCSYAVAYFARHPEAGDVAA